MGSCRIAAWCPRTKSREHYAIQSTELRVQLRAPNNGGCKDSEHPYRTPDDRPFLWMRGYHLGGRSLTWGAADLSLQRLRFHANKKDGHGVDWPIRYADISPWYDRVESFAGISGASEGLEQLPDGQFLQPMDLNCAERRVQEASSRRNHPDAPRHHRPLRASDRAHRRTHRARAAAPASCAASANAAAATARISRR